MAVAVFNTPDIQGFAIATPMPNQHAVQIEAQFTKLPPGLHGFHIHKAGNLLLPGCAGACEHFHVGPHANHGGAPGDTLERHTGDLGNIYIADEGGMFIAHYFINGIHVDDLWGRALIVHADEDDLGIGNHYDSKTTGHSGKRIGCAIFGRLGDCNHPRKRPPRRQRRVTHKLASSK
jgi:superoxide dismutase, Cu-Zn family